MMTTGSPHPSDELLMSELQKGSMESFHALYERYNDRIYRYVYHLVGHRQTAEDCTQDIFIRLYKKAGTYNPKKGRKFSSWFYRVAHNYVVSAFRKKARQRTISMHASSTEEDAAKTLDHILESEEKGAREILESKDVTHFIQAGITRLKEKDRQLIVLCGIEKLPHPEVAAIMGWSVSRVAVRLHRAKKRLAKLLVKL